MITGELKSQVDKIWESFWSGGVANPLTVIEQMTYLIFLRRLGIVLFYFILMSTLSTG